MEQKPNSHDVLAPKRPRTTTSAVLNGATNGATIGGLAFVAPEVATRFFKPNHQVSHRYFQATVIATVVGAAVGAYFSYREAHKLSEYHTALAKRVDDLYAQRDGQAAAR